jgi:hypothetical protein
LLRVARPKPITASDIQAYTGVKLCPTDKILDKTTDQERDTTPGFSYRVELALDRKCIASFEAQLAGLSASQCTQARLRDSGCMIQDTFPKTAKHATVVVHPLGDGRYDLAFFE